MSSSIFIDIPESFSFKSTVYSHGWCDLKPFVLDKENWRLSYVFSTSGGSVAATIYEENGRLRTEIDLSEPEERRLPAKQAKYLRKRSIADEDAQSIVEQARHILRLDENLSGFYTAIDGTERLSWVRERNAGRLLRSPTVFEDLVKTICTTNCSWALTKNMVSNLVEKLGASEARLTPSHGGESRLTAGLKTAGLDTGGLRAFPTPEAMASVGPEFYRDEVRSGYRSPYFVELAESVASGRLDPEKWLISDLPTPELKKEMKKVKGVGDYAAENLLKLVGRYDGLALDSWLRSQFYKNHNSEQICPDKKIERHYSKYGKWRGLAIWCDMTEKWHAPD